MIETESKIVTNKNTNERSCDIDCFRNDFAWMNFSVMEFFDLILHIIGTRKIGWKYRYINIDGNLETKRLEIVYNVIIALLIFGSKLMQYVI